MKVLKKKQTRRQAVPKRPTTVRVDRYVLVRAHDWIRRATDLIGEEHFAAHEGHMSTAEHRAWVACPEECRSYTELLVEGLKLLPEVSQATLSPEARRRLRKLQRELAAEREPAA